MNELLNLYIKNGISLFDEGENVIIIPKAIALEALKLIKELNLIILGGDIYTVNSNNVFSHNYDSWYYNGISSKDSIDSAENYLSILEDKNLYVSFIFK
ncbi:Imm40 family immunity protein [Neisseria sp. 83E34]|uniref:Imm40 family immunity protein n=1 Tax=Neisseria sp. 83E34 TaxID=1692264 RepID=UPI0006CE8871|nr:Imm40 family immunity protein [Neisseria sp. 83E34]KPN70589.1 hypothetical protein AKG09_11315 [Neisseria sp. 83E34]